MHDIIADTSALRKRAKELGIEPLLLGTDVRIVHEPKDVNRVGALLVLGDSDARTLMEAPVDGMVSLEQEQKRDKLHMRRAGLEPVGARILAEGRKALVLSYASVRTSKDPALVIGRMLQNVRVARKAGVPVILASMARDVDELPSPHDMEAFFRAMGVPDDITVKNQQTFSSWLARARTRASDAYVAEGVTRTKGI